MTCIPEHQRVNEGTQPFLKVSVPVAWCSDDLEGWDGGGREVQEEGDTCIPMADSCWCMAESNTIL